MLNTEEIMAYAYYAMFKRFKWRRVTLIVQDENLFKVVSLMQGSRIGWGWEGWRARIYLFSCFKFISSGFNFPPNFSSNGEKLSIVVLCNYPCMQASRIK